MVKINLLTSGGLGDAAMSLAKIHARFSDSLDKIFVTHIRVRDDNLYDIINEFGRFPYRNKVLERKNTTKEKEYLKSTHHDFFNI